MMMMMMILNATRHALRDLLTLKSKN